MRLWVGLLGSLLCALAAPWAPARAEETPSWLPPVERQAIQRVIQDQLKAFSADDASGAFSDASPGIQEMFGDPGRFMAMVKSGYPMVYHPRAATFGALVEIDGRLVQKLRIVGPDGKPALALYMMEREADGTWKIDGCQLTDSDEVGA